MDDTRSDSHQDIIGVNFSGDNNEGGGYIKSIEYLVEDLLLVTADHVRSSFLWVYTTLDPEEPSQMSEQKNLRSTFLIMVFVVALVTVVTWLGLKSKFSQGYISTTLTTQITKLKCTPISTLRLTLRPELKLTIRPTMSPKLGTTVRTYLIRI